MSENKPKPTPVAGRLLKSTSVVGGITVLSRVLGLVRDIVFARFFGAGIVMDAFFVAFKIPNIFRRFFAEGAFSQSFVPVFVEYDETRSREEVRELASKAAGTLGLVLFGFVAVGVVAAPARGGRAHRHGDLRRRRSLCRALRRLPVGHLDPGGAAPAVGR